VFARPRDQQAVKDALTAQEKAVNAALAAAEKAVGKAEQAASDRFEAANNVKAELDRKYGALLAGAVSRPEYEAKTGEIMGRVEALTHDLTVIRQDVAVGSPALRALQQLSDTGIGNAEMSAAGLSSQAHHQGDTMAFAIGTSVVTQAQSTTRGPRPGSSRRCCAAILRLATASAGTTDTRASTHRQAAPSKPNHERIRNRRLRRCRRSSFDAADTQARPATRGDDARFHGGLMRQSLTRSPRSAAVTLPSRRGGALACREAARPARADAQRHGAPMQGGERGDHLGVGHRATSWSACPSSQRSSVSASSGNPWR
jgi:hypothetical protein